MEIKKKDNGYYYVGFQTANGYKWKNTHTTSLPEAKVVVEQAKIVELEHAALAGNLTSEVLASIAGKGRKILNSQAVQEWAIRLARTQPPSTAQNYAYGVAKFLRDSQLMDKPTMQLQSEHIDDYVNADDAGTRTNRGFRLAAIRNYVNYLISFGYVIGDPCRIVKIQHRKLSHQQKEGTKREPMTHDEYTLIVTKAKGFWRWATAISYWTGLRLSDVANLEWSCLQDQAIVVWTQKRDARVALPLSDPLIGGGELGLILLELMETQPSSKRKHIFPEEAKKINDPLTNHRLSESYIRLLRRLGIENKSFHCLRHSFAARLRAAGKTESEIGTLIGHRSEKTTAGYGNTKTIKTIQETEEA